MWMIQYRPKLQYWISFKKEVIWRNAIDLLIPAYQVSDMLAILIAQYPTCDFKAIADDSGKTLGTELWPNYE